MQHTQEPALTACVLARRAKRVGADSWLNNEQADQRWGALGFKAVYRRRRFALAPVPRPRRSLE